MFSYHPGPKVVLVVSHCLCFRHFSAQIIIGIIHGFTYFVFVNFFIETILLYGSSYNNRELSER